MGVGEQEQKMKSGGVGQEPTGEQQRTCQHRESNTDEQKETGMEEWKEEKKGEI